MTRPDLRRSLRYDVQLPCRASSPFRAFDELRGVTANMSRNGLLLRLERGGRSLTMPQLGHAARILLRLPGATAPQGRCVECLGRVVRVEERGEVSCVAFEFRRFQFSDNGAVESDPE